MKDLTLIVYLISVGWYWLSNVASTFNVYQLDYITSRMLCARTLRSPYVCKGHPWLTDTLMRGCPSCNFRYGKIQSVKLQPRNADDDASSASATVAFMDICAASKAHAAENCIESNVLRTDYGQGSATGSAVTRTHEDTPNRPRAASQTQYNNNRTKG